MIKKSTAEAIAYASKISINLFAPVYVLQKKYEKSVVCLSEWVRDQRILAGWQVIAEFKCGQRIK